MIDEVDDKVSVTVFTNGMQSGEFLFSIYKNDLKTMVDMLYKAMRYMNAKDTMIAKKGRPKKRERQDNLYPDKGRKSARTSNQRDDRRSRPLPGKTVNFTPLNTVLDQVLMQLRDNASPTWSDKLKGDLNKRPKNKYCSFPQDHGHDTSECYDLK